MVFLEPEDLFSSDDEEESAPLNYPTTLRENPEKVAAGEDSQNEVFSSGTNHTLLLPVPFFLIPFYVKCEDWRI